MAGIIGPRKLVRSRPPAGLCNVALSRIALIQIVTLLSRSLHSYAYSSA